MQRIEAMQIFLRVAELESFTRAAEHLGLPKASVSTAVQQLEAALGTRLLQRTTRRVQLSQDGRTYYTRCKDLLADFDELQTMFEQGGASLRGLIRVDMPSGIARNFLVARLPEFLEAHPHIELELSSTDRRVDLVREGFDCVIRVGTLFDSSLVARPLGEYVVANCASPDYLRRHGTPRRLGDLAKHKLIHYVQTLGAKSPGFEYPDGDGYASMPMDGQITVNNSDAYLAACLAGIGIIQVPRSAVRALLESGQLVEVLPKLRAEPMPVNLLYPHRRHLSRRVQVFMHWLADTLRPYLQTRANFGAVFMDA
jgi:DNA-binding transcriptional LysR family regulator